VTTELRALLLCDQAFPQAGTGTWSVIGVHDRIFVRELPATHSPLVVFWSLGGFAGEAMVMVTIRDNEGAVVHAVRGMIPKLPVNAVEQAFAFPPVEFKKEGSHTLELQVGEEVVALRSFRVLRVAAVTEKM
jgi:hypothetical protein